MISYGAGHINLMLPLFKYLQSLNRYDIQFMPLSIAEKRMKDEALPYISLTNYSWLSDQRSEFYGEHVAPDWHVDGKGIDFSYSKLYFGLATRDLADELGESEAYRLIKDKGKRAFYPKKTMRAILSDLKPDLVITTSSPRYERATVYAAKEIGIPSISIHDLLAFEYWHKLEADNICVMCEITKQNLINNGQQSKNIIVTGNPAFDEVKNERLNFDKKVLCKRYKLDEPARYILLATQPNCNGRLMAEYIKEYCDNRSNIKAILKPHPGEDITSYLDLSAANLNIISDAPIRELIALSSLTITTYSTVGVEAILMHRPLIQLNLTGDVNPIPLFNFDASLRCETQNELYDSLDRLFGDNKYYIKRVEQGSRFLDVSDNISAVKNISDIVTRVLGV